MQTVPSAGGQRAQAFVAGFTSNTKAFAEAGKIRHASCHHQAPRRRKLRAGMRRRRKQNNSESGRQHIGLELTYHPCCSTLQCTGRVKHKSDWPLRRETPKSATFDLMVKHACISQWDSLLSDGCSFVTEEESCPKGQFQDLFPGSLGTDLSFTVCVK
eukprot:TRINITY_DN56611_c0_g1_i1.p1 TRINITY_DN56611_c0_g1~~TRINITY_DN56611_c0_g1_i1.p1  ORF type:complete len:169 (+),score=9.01 TRINITY_DN56611_c0_g1_i1:36-509(+)